MERADKEKNATAPARTSTNIGMAIGMAVGIILGVFFDLPLPFGVGWGMGLGSSVAVALDSAQVPRVRRVSALFSVFVIAFGVWLIYRHNA